MFGNPPTEILKHGEHRDLSKGGINPALFQSGRVTPVKPMYPLEQGLKKRPQGESTQMHQIGMITNPFNIVLPCYDLNMGKKIPTFGSKPQVTSLVSAKPKSPLSKQYLTPDRFGMFGMNPKQPPIKVSSN